jgi:hypothetical protein
VDGSYDELRQLALAATPGSWEADGKFIHLGVKSRPDPEDEYNFTFWDSTGIIYDEGGHTEADAAYIAAARPEVVLGLLDDLTRLEKAVTLLQENWPRTVPAPMDQP